MENLTVTSVYGTALFEAATDIGAIDDFRETLNTIGMIFSENPKLLALLKAPTIEKQERKSIASDAFEGRVSPEILNFLYVLIDKRRIGQFSDIVKEFEKKCDENNGIIKGEIFSTIPLTDVQIKKFEEETGKLLKKNVKLINQIDKTILGGVKIYLDGKLIDASVRGRLNNLREKIL